MPTWPATIPQKPGAGKWQGGPQNNVVTFQPDVGEPIQRRRSSAIAHVYRATFVGLSGSELSTFKTWFEGTLYDGTLAFDWVDPIYGGTASWRIVADDPPYTVVDVGPDIYDLSMQMMKVPV